MPKFPSLVLIKSFFLLIALGGTSAFAQKAVTLFSEVGTVHTNDPQLVSLAAPKEDFLQSYYALINLSPLFNQRRLIPYQELPDIILNLAPDLNLIGKVDQISNQTAHIDASGGNWVISWIGKLQNKNGLFVIHQEPHAGASVIINFEGRVFRIICHRNVCRILEVNMNNPKMRDLEEHG